MSDEFATLEVHKSGEITVVGFGGRDVLDQVNIAACRDQIAEGFPAARLRNHHRQRLLAERDHVAYDPEMTLIAAALHDLDLTTR